MTIARGHEVTALVRSPSRFPELPAAVVARTGDAGNVEDVAELSAGQDLVISTTRPAPGSEGDLITTTKALLAGLARTGVRLLVVGGAGSLTVPGTGGATAPPHQVHRRLLTFPRGRLGAAVARTARHRPGSRPPAPGSRLPARTRCDHSRLGGTSGGSPSRPCSEDVIERTVPAYYLPFALRT
ncbi:NAD(P)H-binding protein [Kitasatospora sp. GP82]|uniref:NAD(P)-dependent oxidoreductase n=1 Tax=Kitasatospora sp. GP82 TaxID=3035089 RepID=UPI002475EA9A|nr:NAD(P)H-binding protein [Kitasatospora sp. GP82]